MHQNPEGQAWILQAFSQGYITQTPSGYRLVPRVWRVGNRPHNKGGVGRVDGPATRSNDAQPRGAGGGPNPAASLPLDGSPFPELGFLAFVPERGAKRLRGNFTLSALS